MKYRERQVEVDAIQWFKNGDHPGDGPADLEGRVVRYFRHPYVSGTDVHSECERTWHDHGWIDVGAPTNGKTVCPGDWIISGAGGDYALKSELFEAMYEAVEPWNLVTAERDDIKAITKKWLQVCVPCDAGVSGTCTHPAEDYRPVIAALVEELRLTLQYLEAVQHYRRLAEDQVIELINRTTS